MGLKLSNPSIYFGCDPEFFFSKGGQVIGAEKVIPTTGFSAFVLDGVQVELNPPPNPCRANLGNQIKREFTALKAYLLKNPDVKANFSTVINIDPKELESLSDKAKEFGCAPSLNYGDKGADIKVNAATYLKRSAGGHIHLGFNSSYDRSPNALLFEHRERLVPLLDILVGNTCVLVDRDPEATTRRLHYGRASEYRLPKHGLEYRTLSNFWLRSYPLMSFVMGLSRMATSVLFKTVTPNSRPPLIPGYSEDYWETIYPKANYVSYDFETDLLNRVNLEAVRKAINTNNLDLARQNFEGVKDFIREHPSVTHNMGLNDKNLDEFDFFCQMIWEHGIEYWFPEDPIEHWCTRMTEGHTCGAENFFELVVKPKMKAAKESAKISEALNLAFIGESPEILVPNEVIVQSYARDAKGRFISRVTDDNPF